MSVPPMRWTGLLLAFILIPPPTASAQAVGRVVRHSATNGASSGATSRAIGVAAVAHARVAVQSSHQLETGTTDRRRVVGRAHRFAIAVNPEDTPEGAIESETATPVPAPVPLPVESQPDDIGTLTWKPGSLRITGWTDESGPHAYATVNRPDCDADGLNALCVPDDLYELPPTSEPAAPILVAVPLRTQIYPLSYAYYYGLPYPPLALRTASLEVGATPCNSPLQTPSRRAQQQQQLQRKRSSRLFGWLYRSVRNIDMEKSSAPALFYLRSPLLAGFADDMDCPPETDSLESRAEVCATITVRAEKEAARVAQVALPLLDADDSIELRDALETRLNAGEAVVMSTLDGKALLLTPNHVRALDVRPCVPVDNGSDEDDGMPTYAY